MSYSPTYINSPTLFVFFALVILGKNEQLWYILQAIKNENNKEPATNHSELVSKQTFVAFLLT